MSPCPNDSIYPSSSASLLSCTNTSQLADLCAFAVPNIWAGGSLKQPLYQKRQGTFKLFCQQLIKATQISCACIVLALYYVHRLRETYPSVQGSIGSEVRLFTTALVLANKYLDDNTFTNKTWADVSHIPVHELNIMEVEFLSALNYRIHVPRLQFFSWASQCQQWMSPAQQLGRPIKVPTRLAHLKPLQYPLQNTLPLSHSLPILPSLKRSHQTISTNCYYPEPIAKRHLPNTPPSETISHSRLTTPYSTSIYTTNSLQTSNSNPLWKPILSWSSSSRHSTPTTTPLPTMSLYSYSTAASAVAPAAAAVAMTTSHSSMLCARVRCLEIE
ncbi:cyclin-domain-containing protein [Phycomyces nitens]|nr:cyclin-domain-containing protein [Phycomyces nitens]